MFSGQVVHTTLSARAVADFAAKAFRFGASPTARLNSRGWNDVYEVVGQRRFFLRIGRQGRRSLGDAETEAEALAQARGVGASVAVAERGRDGRFAQRLETPEGERTVLLFREAPGSDAQETPEHAFAQGVALARIHAVALDTKTTSRMRRLDLNGLVRLPVKRALAELSERPQLAGKLERVAGGTMREIERLQEELTVGFCHGDFHGYNAAIDGHTATVFDFDEAGIGWIAYDLATFLWARRLVESRRPMWRHFLSGYRSIRPPARADLQALEVFVVVRDLWFLGGAAEGAPHWGRQWFRSTNLAERIDELAAQLERLSSRLT